MNKLQQLPRLLFTITLFSVLAACGGGGGGSAAPTPTSTSDATLSNLVLSAGDLSPAFAKEKTSYTLTTTMASTTVTPTASNAKATIKVNGVTPTSSPQNNTITLKAGEDTTINVVVTSEDGTMEKTYTVIITRKKSSDATLSNLYLPAAAADLASGDLVFAANKTSYKITTIATKTTITPTANHSEAKITLKVNDDVTGVPLDSGTPSADITLPEGTTIISVVVTPEDGTTPTTYTVTITRKNNDTTLSSLSLSAGNPVLEEGTSNYKLTTTMATTTVTATIHPKATFKANNDTNPLASRATSADITLPEGETIITIVVTAEDGKTQKPYTVTITRQNTDATLSKLVLSAGDFDPGQTFNKEITSYTLTTTMATTTVTATTTHPKATFKANKDKVTIDNVSLASGTESKSIDLTAGDVTTIKVVVTAEDGTTKDYTVNITRTGTDASVKLLKLTNPNIEWESPSTSNTETYKSTANTTSTTVTVEPKQKDAKVTIKAQFPEEEDQNIDGYSGNLDLKFGKTTITITVTSGDGNDTKIYVVEATYNPTQDASLSGIVFSEGVTLTPEFDGNTVDYVIKTTDASITETTVTPTVSQIGKASFVIKTGVTEKSTTDEISISTALEKITVTVTAEAKNEKVYNFTVANNVTTLSELTLSGTPLKLGDKFLVRSHTFSTTDETITVNATATHSSPIDGFGATVEISATQKVDGVDTTVNSIEGTPNKFSLGEKGTDTIITVKVTAEDGRTTAPYIVTVTRKSDDATLKSLTLDDLEFKKDKFEYDFTTSATRTFVSALTNHPKAEFEVYKDNVKLAYSSNSGSSFSDSIELPEDKITIIKVVVTAEDGIAEQPYTVTITRESKDTTLSSLALTNGTLVQDGTTRYNFTTSVTTTTTKVEPKANHPKSTITVDGIKLDSNPSVNIALPEGKTTISVVVTAEDGTEEPYTVTIIRQSNDATLSNLVLSAGDFDEDQTFNKETTSYKITTTEASTTVTATTTHLNAKFKANNDENPLDSGTKSKSIDLVAGQDTIINVVVTAEDGTPKEYTVTITRKSDDANLSNLVLSAGSLDPVFHEDTIEYKITTTKATTTVTATTHPKAKATLKVNNDEVGVSLTSDTASNPIDLAAGKDTTINIVVTSEDGLKTKTYLVTITRKSDDATLKNLELSAGDFASGQPFNKDTIKYEITTTQTDTTVTATTTHPNATFTIEPKPDDSNLIALTAGGIKTITVVVTAEDGLKKKTYTIEVTRINVIDWVDPAPAANNKFGDKVVQLPNGNIVVHAPGDIANPKNKGAVHLYGPDSGAALKSFYGLEGDNYGSGGIIALENNNFVVVSPDASNGSLKKVGSVQLIKGANGDSIGEIITNAPVVLGVSANDQIGSNGVTLLKDNKFVISSPNFQRDGASVGRVSIINGADGTVQTLYGDSDNTNYPITKLGDKGITALGNGNFVIVSTEYTFTDVNDSSKKYANMGIVQLVESDGAVKKFLTGQRKKADEKFGGDGITVLANGNFLIATSTHDASENGVDLTNAGSIRLIDGTTGDQLGDTLLGDKKDGYLGEIISKRSLPPTTTIAPLGNNNYVIVHHTADKNGTTKIENAGSIRLFSGVDGTEIKFASTATETGTPVLGDFANDFALIGNHPKITVLKNNNFVFTAPSNDKKNPDNNSEILTNVGSIRLFNGASGKQLAIKYGDIAGDTIGSGGVIGLDSDKYVASSPSASYLYPTTGNEATDGTVANAVGNVMVFNANGTPYPDPILPEVRYDGTYTIFYMFGLSANPLKALSNNKFVINSQTQYDGKGLVQLVDVSGSTIEINRFKGDGDSDRFGSFSGVTDLSNDNFERFAFIAPFDDTTNGIDAGSVHVIDSATGKQIGKPLYSLKPGNMAFLSTKILKPVTGDYFILSQPLADVGEMKDAGKVRKVIP